MSNKKVLIALPPSMLDQVDFVAGQEHRTRSDLIRESLRRYLESFRRSTIDAPLSFPGHYSDRAISKIGE